MGSPLESSRPPLEFSEDQCIKLTKDKSRVCIVGGGPAGLHMAYRLHQMGVQNVTIFDKSDRVCGKVESIEHNGAVHEMGACWLSSSYDWVRALGNELQPGYLRDQEKGIGKTESRDIIVNPANYEVADMPEWMFAHFQESEATQRHLGLLCLLGKVDPLHLRDQLTAGAALKAFEDYKGHHVRLLGERPTFNFPKKPDSHAESVELQMPFGDWLKKHNLTILMPFMSVAQTAQGYGFIDNVPTYYALYWLTPKLITGYLLFAGRKLVDGLGQNLLPADFFARITELLDDAGHRAPPVPTLLKSGWEPLLRMMEDKVPLRTIVNANVTSIKRSEDKVTVGYKLEHTGATSTMDFDFIILAAPMPQLIDSQSVDGPVLDATAEEQDVFGRLKPVTISTHLIDAHDTIEEPGKERQAVVTWPEGLTKMGQGHVYSLKNSRKAITDEDEIGRFVKHSYVTYQLFETPLDLNGREPPQEVTNKMLEDVTKVYRLEDVEVVAKRAYHYFYHFNSEDVAAGYPWKVLQMQGRNRTLYAGCSVSFESVNDIVASNEMLCKYIIKT